MNFVYLEDQVEFTALYSACREAEEFALTKPDISATSARKAMEFIVKYIYTGFEPYPPYGCTVYDMIGDPRFQNQFADRAMLDSIDFIRRTGNAAVHKGNLNVEAAMQVLEHLHFLTGEFAVGVGLIEDYPPYEIPRLNPIREVMAKVHPDNFDLNILPYLRAEGYNAWADALEKNGKGTVSKLYDLPETLICDAFFNFLKQFEISIPDEVIQLLELLPLSYATEEEWEQRRKSLPTKTVQRIECYITSCWTYQGYQPKAKWAEYSRILGNKAPGYVWLVHPEILPHTIREGVVQKKTVISEYGEEAHISLDDALQQIIRHIAGESEEKRNNLTKIPWCKAVLGLPVAMLRNSKRGRENLGEKDKLYCKNSVHFGDQRYIYYIAWDRTQLMKLRSFAGEIGEKLITLDSLADWGFALPGSDAEKRAKERTEIRDMLQLTQIADLAEETKPDEPIKARRKYIRASVLPEGELSTLEIRNYIVNAGIAKWLPMLTSAEWCRIKLGSDHPLLISFEDRQYLLNKQKLRGETPHIYSRTICEHSGKTYYVKRMKTDEFERLKNIVK